MRLALVLCLIVAGACARPAAAPPAHLIAAAPNDALAPGQDEVSMEVIELMCRPCASQIVGDAKQLPGVTSVHMELATKTLTLVFDTSVTRKESVVAEVEEIVGRIQ